MTDPLLHITGMQPNPPPPGGVLSSPRSRLGLLLGLGALVLVVGAGVGGYLVGASQVGHATLSVQVTNNMNANQTVQVTVNGALAGTLTIPAGQTGTLSVPVAYATANGASFTVVASIATGPHDSYSVFVNQPSTFVVNLALG